MLPLYENIRTRRTELELTQEQLAKATGYADKSMIAKIEKGIIDLPLSKIKIFAEALDMTPSELMGNTFEEADILANARDDVIKHFDGDPYEIAQYSESERSDAELNVIAAHHDGDWTEDELNEIEQFKEYVLSKRKK